MSCGSIDFTPAMPGPARRRVGDNAGGGGRRWGQSGSGALGPAKAGPAVAEIGRVPCRDRFSSAPKCRPRRERGRAPAGVVPPRAPDRAAPGPTSTAGSYPTPHGRTQIHEVVPGLARSYLKAPLQYDPAPQRTTTRIHVRPREPGYDRPEVTAAGPVGRTTARATAPPHDPPTAPDPTRPITPTPRPRPPTPTASRTARPSADHHRPRHEPPHRTTTTNEPNSTTRTENRRRPAVLRAEGDGPPSHEHARLPHDRDHHQDRRPVSVIYPDWRPRRSSPRPRGRGNDRPSRRA